MRNILLLLSTLILCCINLRAEEYIPRYASLEKDGKNIKVDDVSNFPTFNADFYPSEDVVKIRCTAGNLVLKKGIFFYGYSGIHKGLRITARAYVENGKLEQIVYEEFDEHKNIRATVNYFKK